ncbi:DUF899 domain-containing protein [Dactylosporangium siamense]|nr:DUF899 domain-containing protein [Dactylosporangium siamense]
MPLPQVTDRQAWQAKPDELRVKEKADLGTSSGGR